MNNSLLPRSPMLAWLLVMLSLFGCGSKKREAVDSKSLPTADVLTSEVSVDDGVRPSTQEEILQDEFQRLMEKDNRFEKLSNLHRTEEWPIKPQILFIDRHTSQDDSNSPAHVRQVFWRPHFKRMSLRHPIQMVMEKLPDDFYAWLPSEVNVVVLLDSYTLPIGKYDNGANAAQTNCDVLVINLENRSIIERKSFQGGQPASAIIVSDASSDSGARGSEPDANAIREWICQILTEHVNLKRE